MEFSAVPAPLQAVISTGSNTGVTCADGANSGSPTCGFFKDSAGKNIQCVAMSTNCWVF